MRRSVRYVRLYSPSFEEIPHPLIAWLKRMAINTAGALLAMAVLWGIMEIACRLRGWY